VESFNGQVQGAPAVTVFIGADFALKGVVAFTRDEGTVFGGEGKED